MLKIKQTKRKVKYTCKEKTKKKEKEKEVQKCAFDKYAKSDHMHNDQADFDWLIIDNCQNKFYFIQIKMKVKNRHNVTDKKKFNDS
jgi:hypothetical protein